jgi:hypothetical protein
MAGPVRRVDHPTEVEVRFEQDGRPYPLSFTWEGERLRVTSVGRTWLDDAGRHLLVMTMGDRVFELLLRRSDLAWRVVGVPERPSYLAV